MNYHTIPYYLIGNDRALAIKLILGYFNPLQRKPLSCITKYESIGYILLFWSNSEKNQKKSFVPEKLKILKNLVLVPLIVKISKSSNILFLVLYLRVSHK